MGCFSIPVNDGLANYQPQLVSLPDFERSINSIILQWWQLKYFGFFIPNFGKERAYFSDGLVQPPTSIQSDQYFLVLNTDKLPPSSKTDMEPEKMTHGFFVGNLLFYWVHQFRVKQGFVGSATRITWCSFTPWTSKSRRSMGFLLLPPTGTGWWHPYRSHPKETLRNHPFFLRWFLKKKEPRKKQWHIYIETINWWVETMEFEGTINSLVTTKIITIITRWWQLKYFYVSPRTLGNDRTQLRLKPPTSNHNCFADKAFMPFSPTSSRSDSTLVHHR